MAGPNERVQQRAYSIWEAEGKPEGRDKEHWLQAEREAEDVTQPPVDGPVTEDGPERSAEVGIESVIDASEEEDPSVTGAATLRDED